MSVTNSTMTGRAKKQRFEPTGVLARLRADDAAQVLRLLSERHLEAETTKFSETLATNVDVEVLGENVANVVFGVDLAQVDGRTGRLLFGDVDPPEIIWEAVSVLVRSVGSQSPAHDFALRFGDKMLDWAHGHRLGFKVRGTWRFLRSNGGAWVSKQKRTAREAGGRQ